jgi:hypothetical protein
MRNGLYKANFQTEIGVGSGVIFAQDGKLWGGDATMYYTGRYVSSGDIITAQVNSHIHTRMPGTGSVFGLDELTVSLKGTSRNDVINISGTAREAPSLAFTAVLTRLSD